MKKILVLICLLAALTAYGQQQKRIAIVNTEDDGEPQLKIQELFHLTDKLREIANKVLPSDKYAVMTQQSIQDNLGSLENMQKKCSEAQGCLAKLGREINADYIGQARIGRFGEELTIKVELYGSGNGTLINSFTGTAKNIYGLSSIIDQKAPDLFQKMLPKEQPVAAAAPPPAPVIDSTAIKLQQQMLEQQQQMQQMLQMQQEMLKAQPNGQQVAATPAQQTDFLSTLSKIRNSIPPTQTSIPSTQTNKATNAIPNKNCDSETANAKTILEKCLKMGKSASGYPKCADDYKAQKAKAEQACGSNSSAGDLETAVRKWEEQSNIRGCRSGGQKKDVNCATILQQWGQQLFKLEESKGTNHDGSLPIFLDYVIYFPDGNAAPGMLFQSSFIYEVKGDKNKAFELRKILVSEYPNHALAPSVWLRIGEYYYENSKWLEAIMAYEKASTSNKKEATYAIYHLAESYYNMANYDAADKKFTEYLNGIGNGTYGSDLRNEAENYITRISGMKKR